MMKSTQVICLLIASLSTTVHAHSLGDLSMVNVEIGDISWSKMHADGDLSTAGEKERIQAHLGYVLTLLRKRDRRDWPVETRSARKRMLRALADYRNRGRFPRRTADDFTGRRPRFIDDRGTSCAVGYLLITSGHEALAKSIARDFEYAYVPDIDDPALQSWAARHGFSLSDLAMIQPAYRSMSFERTVSIDIYGGLAPVGVGPAGGLRGGISLLRPGWFGEASGAYVNQDLLRLTVGVDFYYARQRDEPSSPYGLAIGVPIGLTWETYSRIPLSYFVELGANIYLHPGVLRGNENRFVDHWTNWLNVGVGGIWRFTERIAAIVRLGLPVTGFALRYELGDTVHRPGP